MAVWNALWGLQEHTEVREEFSKFLWGIELSSSAYSDKIWPTGKILKKTVLQNYVFLSKVDRASFSLSTGAS